jgi:excisionase family DNA binding protein
MAQATEKLAIKDVARELSRSLEQVRRYIREGKLPAEKLGMQWFVDPEDLDAFKGAIGTPTSLDALTRASSLRRSIEERSGRFDIVAMVDESRERGS